MFVPSTTQVLQVFFGILLAVVIYFLYIKPKRLMRFYEKQGIPMEYRFGIGYFQINMLDVHLKGDFYHSWKEFGRKGAPAVAFGGNLVGIAHVTLVDPALIKAFYVNEKKYYCKNEMWASVWKKLFQHGLLLAEDQEWKRHRKLISGAFHHDFFRDMTPDIGRIVDRSFETLKTKNLDSVPIMTEFQAITGELIGRLFFGEEFHTYFIKGIPVSYFLADLIARMSAENFELNVMLFGSKFLDLGILPRHRAILEDVRLFREFSTKIVEKKFEEVKLCPAEAKERKNIIDVMLAQRAIDPKDQLTDTEIIEEFVTFFSAGMDTTGHTITLATYYLHKNPQYRAQVMQEVEENFQDTQNITLDILNKNEMCLAFMKEVLRFMHPAGAIFDRIAKQDHDLGKLKISKGTSVNIGYFANNYNPNFHDNVETFDPERWTKPSKTRDSISKDPYVYIPFSSGTHNCIGQHFAMIQARMIFGMFLKKFEFDHDPKYKLKMCLRFLYEPYDEIKYKLTVRS